MNFPKQILSVAMFTLCIVLPVFAENVKIFTDRAAGYSIAYPQSWFVPEGDVFTVFSSKDYASLNGGGAAVMVRVLPLEVSDLKPDGNPVKRLMTEVFNGWKYSIQKPRTLSGKVWQSVSFNTGTINIGQAFCIEYQEQVFLIATAYSDSRYEKQYKPDVESIVKSFNFTPVVYTQEKNTKLGVGFEYPSHWQVTQRTDSGYMIMSRNPANPQKDAVAGIAIAIKLEKDTEGAIDDMIVKMIESGLHLKITLHPENRTIAGLNWKYAEGENEQYKARLMLRKHGERLVMITILVNPSEYEKNMEIIFSHFYNTLKLD